MRKDVSLALSLRRCVSSLRASRTRPISRAFTLIELLVVIAIIALLISILLPSLSAAREQAKAVACSANLHGLGNGLVVYATEYHDWIPGVNTSGVALRTLKAQVFSRPELLHRKRLPVQMWDWISPILVLEDSISGNRAQRFQLLTNLYKCPSQGGVESDLYTSGDGGMPDLEDFEALGRWNAVSYLMPIHFQLWGSNAERRRVGRLAGIGAPLLARVAPSDWEVRSPSYVSQVGRVGSPAKKIVASDGSRSLDGDSLQHDVTLYPSLYGSFTTSGAWWSGSSAYGVQSNSQTWDGRSVTRGSPSEGRNLSLSYRHGRTSGAKTGPGNRASINALFFDGHVSRLDDRESRNIEFWYPKGSVVSEPAEGMTFAEEGDVVP